MGGCDGPAVGTCDGALDGDCVGDAVGKDTYTVMPGGAAATAMD